MTGPLILQLRARAGLSDADAESLVGILRPVRTVEEHRDIVTDGSKPQESIVLLDGLAARYKITAEGKRQITQLHVPGDFVDLHSYLLHRMDHGVIALTNCVVAGAPHEALREITVKSYDLTWVLWLSTTIDAAVHRTWVTQLGRADAYRRSAHLICELYVRLSLVGRVRQSVFDLPLTQSDVGDMLGLSVVHMNRTLAQLRDNGLVTWKKGTMTVHNIEALKEAASFDPTYLSLK